MATVASKVLERIAALTKDFSSQGQVIEKKSLLSQNLKQSYSSNEEQLVDQEQLSLPKLILAPFNEIQANAMQIAEIKQHYLYGLENNVTRISN